MKTKEIIKKLEEIVVEENCRPSEPCGSADLQEFIQTLKEVQLEQDMTRQEAKDKEDKEDIERHVRGIMIICALAILPMVVMVIAKIINNT